MRVCEGKVLILRVLAQIMKLARLPDRFGNRLAGQSENSPSAPAAEILALERDRVLTRLLWEQYCLAVRGLNSIVNPG